MADILSSSSLSPQNPCAIDPYSVFDDEIPTVDYSLLFSDDPHQRSLALEHIGQACHDFGFFYLVNHEMPDKVLDNLFKGITEFFDPKTMDERRVYSKKDPRDRIRWELNRSGEDREYIKVSADPQYHFPTNPSSFSEILEEYYTGMRKIVVGLARALSKTLGFDEETYLENAFNLESGFDVSSLNLYPPSNVSKGRIGLGDHTDPGFIITLVQNVDGGLQILSHQGRWINVRIPHHAILIQLGDQLEILTNGRYKSDVHRVVVDSNKVQRISVATLHGPSLDNFVSPAPEFVDQLHPKAYLGMTYKQFLEANGNHEIDTTSSLHLIKLPNVN